MGKSILDLETRLGLNEGFFDGLKSEDDWSFVIKLRALFEAACTHLLLFHFQEPELADFFSRIDVSAKPIGKLAIGSCTALIDTWLQALLPLKGDRREVA
jgi:hypothetical protein